MSVFSWCLNRTIKFPSPQIVSILESLSSHFPAASTNHRMAAIVPTANIHSQPPLGYTYRGCYWDTLFTHHDLGERLCNMHVSSEKYVKWVVLCEFKFILICRTANLHSNCIIWDDHIFTGTISNFQWHISEFHLHMPYIFSRKFQSHLHMIYFCIPFYVH